MTKFSTLRGTTRCPKCSGTADPTGWIPLPGNDPMMRKFVCRSCRCEFFYLVPDPEQLMNVRERVKALREAGEFRNTF